MTGISIARHDMDGVRSQAYRELRIFGNDTSIFTTKVECQVHFTDCLPQAYSLRRTRFLEPGVLR